MSIIKIIQSQRLLLLLAVGFALIIAVLFFSRPSQKRQFTPPSTHLSVQAIRVEERNFQTYIQSYGLVQAKIKNQVFSQVSGRIDYIAENFRDGAHFNKDEILLKIEQDDYDIALALSEAKLAEAESNLAEEQARVTQAKTDWQRLERSTAASSLVLRQPQLKAAEAKLAGAIAEVRRAQLDVERCTIRAPFTGRSQSLSVDMGQYINSNSLLGEIFASSNFEVRLTIKNKDLAYLDLPTNNIPVNTTVKLFAGDVAQPSNEKYWPAQLVRTASHIDDDSRQLYVVAALKSSNLEAITQETITLETITQEAITLDTASRSITQAGSTLENMRSANNERHRTDAAPYSGQYVKALIPSKTIPNAISIANTSIYQGRYVYVYRDGALYRQDIQLRWQGPSYSLLSSGLNHGDILVSTPLGQVNSGTEALITNAKELGISSSTDGKSRQLKDIDSARLKKLKQETEAASTPLKDAIQTRAKQSKTEH
ncbi:MAG: RND family efflux transporter MFP subunit [Flavobacteriales bacterium]|jgi:RND family efflux transporter MFP subunit